jgi:DsbC/DsbD-like thiol-disulfide interchange protein
MIQGNRCGRIFGTVLLVGLALAWGLSAQSARAAKTSDSVIKVTATADKPDSEGKQVVTITLNIDKGWHAYANPIGGKDFPGLPTQVTVKADNKAPKVKIDYPKGKQVTDKDFGNHFIYEDKAVIKATVSRGKGDTGPLEVSVRIQACDKKSCLMPATVKLTIK